jgi:hypothetical protein
VRVHCRFIDSDTEFTCSTHLAQSVVRCSHCPATAGTVCIVHDVNIVCAVHQHARAVTAPVLCRRVRIDELQPIWYAKRAEALQRAGLPANSTTCPQRFDSTDSRTTKGVAIGVAVGGACLVAIISGGLYMYRHKVHRGHLGGKGGLWWGLPSAIAHPDSAAAAAAAAPTESKPGTVAVLTKAMSSDGGSAHGHYSSCSSSTPWIGSSPFAAFLAQALQPPPSTNTTSSTQQPSTSGGRLPTSAATATTASTSCYGSKSTSTSHQASDGNSGDNVGPLPGLALQHDQEE